MAQFLSFLKYYWYFLISHFEGYAPVIRMTVLLAILLIVYYIGVFVRIFLIARRMRVNEKREKKIKRRYDDRIQRLMYNEREVTTEEADKILNPENYNFKKWGKIHLTNLVLETKRESGWDLENYKKLLEVLPLISFWEKRLKSNDVKKNREALRKLDEIHENIPGSIYITKLHSRNHELRKHAKSGYMKYAAHDAFKVLDDDFDKKFNELDKIRIHDALIKRAGKDPLPSLLRWVYLAKNEMYKSFLIQEIGYFGQSEVADKLLKLYKKENSNVVKAQIASTLGVLKYEAAIPVLAADYEYSSTPVQTAIVEAMGDMGTGDSLRFLEEKYPLAQDVDLQIAALKNISKIDQEAANRLAGYRRSANLEYSSLT